jgi:phospho-N-acetylmuramoyl-pentapeptide-transferase
MTCNGDWWAAHYMMWDPGYGWESLLTLGLIGWVTAQAVIPIVIGIQRKASVGQQIYESGPAAHLTKQGTPTMGGLAFAAAAIAAAVYLWATFNTYNLGQNLGLFLLAAAIGFVDDFLKLKRRTALGLRARSKMLLLLVVGAVAAYYYIFPSATDCASWWTWGGAQWWFGHLIYLPALWYYFLAIAAVVACANAVNLTDGVDGLAGVSILPPLIALSILDGRGGGIAVAAAVAVFLYFNFHPAKVFMGDTGSIALGALLAFLAIRNHLLLFLPLLGIVFVVEAL